jgi:hypothetical protein
MPREAAPGMKNINKSLRLSAETVRNLVLAPPQLAGVAGGAHTNQCVTNTACDPQIIANAKVASSACGG